MAVDAMQGVIAKLHSDRSGPAFSLALLVAAGSYSLICSQLQYIQLCSQALSRLFAIPRIFLYSQLLERCHSLNSSSVAVRFLELA